MLWNLRYFFLEIFFPDFIFLSWYFFDSPLRSLFEFAIFFHPFLNWHFDRPFDRFSNICNIFPGNFFTLHIPKVIFWQLIPPFNRFWNFFHRPFNRFLQYLQYLACKLFDFSFLNWYSWSFPSIVFRIYNISSPFRFHFFKINWKFCVHRPQHRECPRIPNATFISNLLHTLFIGRVIRKFIDSLTIQTSDNKYFVLLFRYYMLEDRRFILFSARCYITADYENVPWRGKHVPLSRRHDFSFSPHATIGIWKRSELKKKKKSYYWK